MFRRLTLGFVFALFCSLSSTLQAQDTLRVMQYNLLRYGAQGINGCTPTGVTARNAWFSTIMNATQPDIFGVNEIGPFGGPTGPWNNILLNILQPIHPDYAATTLTFNGNQDVANMLYYRSDKLGLAKEEVIPHSFRDLNYYKFYYKGPGLAAGDTTFLEIVLFHLSASNATQRSTQTQAVMDYLDTPDGPRNIIIMGDMNMDGGGAQAFQNMIAHANSDIRMYDPLNQTGTWSNNNQVNFTWSQSTRANGSNDCGSGGGLDDRFDIILGTNSLINGSQDLSYVPGSYHVVGNPHAPNPAVTQAVSSALVPMSDHHPVVMDIEVSRAVAVDPALASQASFWLKGHPADEQLAGEFELPVWEEEVRLRLLDLQGRVLASQHFSPGNARQQFSFDTRALAPGMYLLDLEGDSRNWGRQRVVVAH